MFGGFNEEQGNMSDVYIIDLSTMVCVIVSMCSCVTVMGIQTVMCLARRFIWGIKVGRSLQPQIYVIIEQAKCTSLIYIYPAATG